MELPVFHHKIYEIRGQKIMLDYDLAALYEVETRVLNQAIKRNMDNFPEDFMFRITAKEWEGLHKSKALLPLLNSSHFVMSSIKHRGKLYTPYAFTEHGVAMLASILKSPKARKMNIAIVRAFIALRKSFINFSSLKEQIAEIRVRIGEHDIQLAQIYDSIELLLDEKVEQKSWDDRPRIGFTK